MTPDNAKFFYEISKNRWGIESIEALVDEEIYKIYQDMLNAVEQEHFHAAAILRGRIQAWESLMDAIHRCAKQYQPPRAEFAA